MKSKNNEFVVFLIVLLAGFIIAVPGLFAQDINRTLNVAEGGTLTIDSDLGSIDVKTRQGTTVEIDIEFEARSGGSRRLKEFLEDFDVDIRHSRDDVTIIAEYDRDDRRFWDRIGRYVRVRFYITVPKVYNVDLKTSGGSISVDDLEGEVFARTSGGSLEFGRIIGPVEGTTSGGSIRLSECKSIAKVKTSGGSITIGRVDGEVRAVTSGGSIRVDEVMGAIDATTSGGSVTASISKQPQSNCRLKTSGGGITVYLTEDVGVDLDARTSGGRVRTDFPVTIRGEISKRALRAKINGGGPELYLRTSGGSISIKEM